MSNPPANGIVKKVHCSPKASLMACTNENWKSQLPWVLLSLWTTPRANGKVSPAEKVTKRLKPKDLDTCSYVFIRNDAHRHMMWPYRGPYCVVKTAPKAYCLMIHGQEDWVKVDRLKLAFLTVDNNGANTEKGHSRVPLENKPPPTQCNQPRRQTVELPGHPFREGILLDDTSEVSAYEKAPVRRYQEPGGAFALLKDTRIENVTLSTIIIVK
ncbi:uncharacterized protein [Palaemon carinicauda]|uniref:uncharacterized protein n=1 Tax=Palaemon carinicauda TaxID=392227 RepID=UPI0035B6232A